MVRAGYDPKGTVRFFERILEEEKQYPNDIPPYLFSHPEVADRIEAIEIAAASLKPTQPMAAEPAGDGALAAALPVVQARLAKLKQAKRTHLPAAASPTDRTPSRADLGAAQALADAGELDAALLQLAAAEAASPDDPRIPYLKGELLFEAGRFAEAAASYRRTAQLDASRAKVFYQMGLAYKEIGDRPRAVYALEQAAVRAGETSTLRRRADWEVFKLTFTILLEVGFADGEKDGETPAGAARDSFAEGASRLAWWARLNPRFRHWSEHFSLRWTAPDGRVMQDEEIDELADDALRSRLDLEPGAAAGTWTAELHLRGESVDRRNVEVRPR
jgi:tetratricopeptide (TPR) repeat protein